MNTPSPQQQTQQQHQQQQQQQQRQRLMQLPQHQQQILAQQLRQSPMTGLGQVWLQDSICMIRGHCINLILYHILSVQLN